MRGMYREHGLQQVYTYLQHWDWPVRGMYREHGLQRVYTYLQHWDWPVRGVQDELRHLHKRIHMHAVHS